MVCSDQGSVLYPQSRADVSAYFFQVNYVKDQA